MKKIVFLILLSLFVGCGKGDKLPEDLSGWTVDAKPISVSRYSGKTNYYVDISKRDGQKLLERRIKVSAQEQDALARGVTIQQLFGKVEKE